MKSGNRKSAGLAALALVALAGLAACTVVVEDRPPPRPQPIPGPQICTREFAPVCARRGGDRQTFGNACLADAAGYRVTRPGPCRGDGPGAGPGPDRPQFCTREYAPVCARRGRNVRTFGNACEADSADFRILYRGPCR